MKICGIDVIIRDDCPENTAYLAVSRTDPITGLPVLVDAVKVVKLDNKKTPQPFPARGKVQVQSR